MNRFNLSLNGNVIIIFNEKYYKSTVQDLHDDDFSINIPIGNGEYLSLHPDDEVEVNYYADGGNYYVFTTKVISRKTENKIVMYTLERPETVKKIQRRNYVRVSLAEYAVYKSKKDDDKNWQQGLLLDLSGGGLRIKVKERMMLNDKIIINIHCDQESYSVIGKIVRCDKTELQEYICGIEFVELDERKRDRIIDKVFTIMRKQRELS